MCRLAEKFFETLSPVVNLTVHPQTRLTTYVDSKGESTLDYWAISVDVRVLTMDTGPWTSCQHRLLSLQAVV
jgi:hypothetical protein